jgi:hypothetical protein
LTEFGIIGVISTGIYQLVKRYNCHEPAVGASARILPPVASSRSAIATTQTSKDGSRRTR